MNAAEKMMPNAANWILSRQHITGISNVGCILKNAADEKYVMLKSVRR